MTKPEWWPDNPFPRSVFTMTIDGYVEAVPDERLRTAISGALGYHFWKLASDAILEAYKEAQPSTPTETTAQPRPPR